MALLLLCRADSIVKDAEAIRKQLVPRTQAWDGKWSILGQSFGGFCCVTYLSQAPEGELCDVGAGCVWLFCYAATIAIRQQACWEGIGQPLCSGCHRLPASVPPCVEASWPAIASAQKIPCGCRAD